MKSKIGAILLAAGNSERMGQCKFLLTMANGLTFFENIIQTFSNFGIKKIVVVSQSRYINVLETLCLEIETKPTFVANDFPEFGRFYSLQLGIKAIGNVEFSFIQNADSPFIDLETLKLLELNKNKADYICPMFKAKGGHPVLVNNKTLKRLFSCPKNSNLREVLNSNSRWNVSVDNDLITVDIDTLEDYKKYFN